MIPTMIVKLREKDINDAAALLTDCFYGDGYYSGASKDELNAMFLSGFPPFIESGLSVGCRLQGTLAGVALAFDYQKLRRKHPADFLKMFEAEDPETQAKVDESRRMLEAAMGHDDFVYIPLLAVRGNSRGIGLATKLMARFDALGANLITDASSPYTAKICRKLGWKEAVAGKASDIWLKTVVPSDDVTSL
jgi:ribosomal protein S18 acetylase RimI-like enzyme